MWTYNYSRSPELYHHGVLGMKWGVRKEYKPVGRKSKAPKPPKPKSKHRLKLENRYLQKGKTQEEAEKAAAKRIRVEKILAAAGVLTVAAVTAYIARNEYLKNKTVELINSGKIADTFTNGGNVGKTIFPKQQGKMSPELNAIFSNPDYLKNSDYLNNCGQSVTAMELRSRGLSVKAKPQPKGGTLITELMTNFKKPNLIAFDGLNEEWDFAKNSELILNEISSWPEKSRGYVLWGGTIESPGHIFTAIKDNDNIKFLDPQLANSINHPDIKKKLSKAMSINFDNLVESYGEKLDMVDAYVLRTDNLEINKSIFKQVTRGDR